MFKVHPWVNYESLLKKCLVGKLVTPIDEDIFSTPAATTKTQSVNSVTASSSTNKKSSSLSLPKPVTPEIKTDWYQQQDYVTIVIYREDSSKEVCFLFTLCYYLSFYNFNLSAFYSLTFKKVVYISLYNVKYIFETNNYYYIKSVIFFYWRLVHFQRDENQYFDLM